MEMVSGESGVTWKAEVTCSNKICKRIKTAARLCSPFLRARHEKNREILTR